VTARVYIFLALRYVKSKPGGKSLITGVDYPTSYVERKGGEVGGKGRSKGCKGQGYNMGIDCAW
jgi:hypothetical protein